MTGDILAIDIGTSALKLGVFTSDLEKRCEARRSYNIHVYDQGKADIEPETWWRALRECCIEVRDELRGVSVVSLSVTTPGLTPMDSNGTALAPAVLFLDGRSHAQATRVREVVGDDRFLAETANLPVSGGSSLSSILWFRDVRPDIWSATSKFGHCNTYIIRRMTGLWAIDPSTTSITGLYNTAQNDLTWNQAVLDLAGVPVDLLPPLFHSHEVIGPVLPSIATELGLPVDCVVLCGGNDATLAALSGGVTEPGQISIVSGTCDIASVCTDAPISSANFNVRCHVVPGRWLTFFVLNTGGEALDWFHRTICREMDEREFFDGYLPRVLGEFFSFPVGDDREAELPSYEPYLGGSRYSLDRLTASFGGLTLETTREDLLVSVIRGNMKYLGQHFAEMAGRMHLSRTAWLTGGGARIPGILAARRRWTGDFDYVFQDQSSMLGAAMLAKMPSQY